MNLPSRPSPRAQAATLVGSVVADRYRIEEVVAVGGIGAVYRAEHVHMRRTVALKVLRPDVDGFPELVTRFEREAVAGGSLRHPNVASAIDFGRLSGGAYYLVVEFVPGRTLRALIRKGPIRPARAFRIARQVALGIGACHRLGIVHRDLKPRNVMVDESAGDLVKIIDFGLARVPVHQLAASSLGEHDDAPTRKDLTLHGIVFGTVAYMAPETALGMDAVDERSDLYALGVLLYEMLAGRHPFDPDDPTELFLCHRITEPAPIFDRSPGVVVPPGLEAVVRRLLAKRPVERFQTADDLVAALDEVARTAGLSPNPSAIDPRPSQPSRPARRGMMPTPLSTPGAFALPMAHELGGHDIAHLDFEHGTQAPRTSPQVDDAPPAPSALDVSGRLWFRPRARWLVGLMATLLLAAGLMSFWRMGDGDLERPISTPAATQPAAAPAASSPPSVTSGDAPVARARLLSALQEQKWQAGASSLLYLLELDPGALEDPEIYHAAVKVSLRAAFSEWAESGVLFDTLAERAGHEGLDVLYEMLASQGGSRGARLAADRLARPAVRVRANPALSVVLELREAKCSDKASLFERAARDGDHRARLYLEQLVSRRCDARRGMCCYHSHAGLRRAIAALPEP